MQAIVPCLWFNGQAEEAVNFYASVFPETTIRQVSRYDAGGPMPAGTVLTIAFELQGQEFLALNGTPEFPFSPAVSFIVYCDSQAEIDRYWSELTADGGQPVQCGWLQDRFGLSWQIVPRVLPDYITDPDPQKSQRVLAALRQMQKLDIAGLQQAYLAD